MKWFFEYLERNARGEAAGFGIWALAALVTFTICSIVGTLCACLVILTLHAVGWWP